MQGLALFNIFINDLGEGAVSVLIKLAEDIKSGGVSKKKKRNNPASGLEILENYLRRL